MSRDSKLGSLAKLAKGGKVLWDTAGSSGRAAEKNASAVYFTKVACVVPAKTGCTVSALCFANCAMLSLNPGISAVIVRRERTGPETKGDSMFFAASVDPAESDVSAMASKASWSNGDPNDTERRERRSGTNVRAEALEGDLTASWRREKPSSR